jgi:leader peptidase (prepilin peptidase)/N-methyltransferase
LIEVLFAFLFGLLIGSFLNVCIHRWPRDESVVWPGSRCAVCGHPIAWYDNVPVLSYVLLRGRCRHCLVGIHWRYPVVELLTGALFAAGAAKWGATPEAAKFMLFASMQVGMIFCDLETRLLPDQFTIGGIALGLVAAALVPFRDGMAPLLVPASDPRVFSVVESALAAAVAGGSLWGVAWLYSRVRGREGLGFGDVKMVAMMGAFLGLGPAMLAIFLGCILGTVLGVGYALVTRQDLHSYELPFGTFLGIAAIAVAVTAT